MLIYTGDESRTIYLPYFPVPINPLKFLVFDKRKITVIQQIIVNHITISIKTLVKTDNFRLPPMSIRGPNNSLLDHINIDRIKKEYFDSNYGLKEGDKIRILHETGDEMIGFLKKVEVCEDGDLYLTIQKQNEKGDRGRGTWNMYLSSKSIKIEKCV